MKRIILSALLAIAIGRSVPVLADTPPPTTIGLSYTCGASVKADLDVGNAIYAVNGVPLAFSIGGSTQPPQVISTVNGAATFPIGPTFQGNVIVSVYGDSWQALGLLYPQPFPEWQWIDCTMPPTPVPVLPSLVQPLPVVNSNISVPTNIQVNPQVNQNPSIQVNPVITIKISAPDTGDAGLR